MPVIESVLLSVLAVIEAFMDNHRIGGHCMKIQRLFCSQRASVASLHFLGAYRIKICDSIRSSLFPHNYPAFQQSLDETESRYII